MFFRVLFLFMPFGVIDVQESILRHTGLENRPSAEANAGGTLPLRKELAPSGRLGIRTRIRNPDARYSVEAFF